MRLNSEKGNYLKFKKTLHGIYQSLQTFWKYINRAINLVGMNTLEFNLCIFIGERELSMEFVDDILFQSTDKKFVNALRIKLMEPGSLLEKEYDAACFLGITTKR